MKIFAFLILAPLLLSSVSARAACALAQLTGTKLELLDTVPTEIATGTQRVRFWNFTPSQVVITERLNDMPGCKIEDQSCTQFETVTTFEISMDSRSCKIELNGVSEVATDLRDFEEPNSQGSQSTIKYSKGERVESYEVRNDKDSDIELIAKDGSFISLY